MTKTLTIKNATAEFLIFTTQVGEDNINVRVENENIWLMQKLMAQLFEVKIATLNEHLKIFLIAMNWTSIQLLGIF